MLGFVLSRYPFWYSSVVIGVKLMLKLRSWPLNNSSLNTEQPTQLAGTSIIMPRERFS
jgi:hypothetical protein